MTRTAGRSPYGAILQWKRADVNVGCRSGSENTPRITALSGTGCHMTGSVHTMVPPGLTIPWQCEVMTWPRSSYHARTALGGPVNGTRPVAAGLSVTSTRTRRAKSGTYINAPSVSAGTRSAPSVAPGIGANVTSFCVQLFGADAI